MEKEIERRVVTSPLSLRAAPSGVASPGVLEGYAAKFNTWSEDLGGFREQIKPGAFDRALREKQDVRMLLNHDPSIVLGRWKAGTIGLKADSTGLHFHCVLPDTQDGRDVHTLVKRGDVTQCSFAFKIPDGGQQWYHATEEGTGKKFDARFVTDLDLFDVSVVTYPAYEDTEVSARNRLFAYRGLDAAEDVRARALALGERIRLHENLIAHHELQMAREALERLERIYGNGN